MSDLLKENCWELKKCDREQGGTNIKSLGVCPASTLTKANGLNHGSNGGRCCWAIAGTLCGGKVQKSFVSKLKNCLKCDVYKKIQEEEGKNFLFAKEIQEFIKK